MRMSQLVLSTEFFHMHGPEIKSLTIYLRTSNPLSLELIHCWFNPFHSMKKINYLLSVVELIFEGC